jgi:hypothetical protein
MTERQTRIAAAGARGPDDARVPPHLMRGASRPAPDAGPSKKFKPAVRRGWARGRGATATPRG